MKTTCKFRSDHVTTGEAGEHGRQRTAGLSQRWLIAAVLVSGFALLAGGTGRDEHEIHAGVKPAKSREAFLSGGERSELILKEISETLKRIEKRVEQIEKRVSEMPERGRTRQR